MRYTIGDVLRAPTRLPDWWVEWPWRRRPLRRLRLLLFTPGRGWLRWGWDSYTEVEPILEDGSGPAWDVPCAPPLRRAAAAAWSWMVSFPKSWILKARGERLWVEPEHMRCDDWSWAKDPEWPEGYL